MPLDVGRFQSEDFILQVEVEAADRATALVGPENVVTKRPVTSPCSSPPYRRTVRKDRRFTYQKFGRKTGRGAYVLV